MIVSRLQRGFVWSMLFGVVAACGSGAVQVQQAKDPIPKEPAPPTYAFAFSNAPWSTVLNYLTKVTGLPVAAPYRPRGFFTFAPPKSRGRAKQYTVAEIFDIVNESLLLQNLFIVRRVATIGIFRADEPLDGSIWTCEIGELANRAKEERVRVVYPLKIVNAEAIATRIRKVMGPCSQLLALDEGNQLILIDTVANLRTVITILKDMEDRNRLQSFVHHCRHCLAQGLAEKLREIVAIPRRLRLAKGLQVTVLAEPAANIILFSGPGDKLAIAKAIVEMLDAPRRPQRVLRSYAVPPANAKAVAELLQDIYKQAHQAGNAIKKEPAQPTHAFAFRNAPWSAVLEYLTKISGMPVATPCRPTGSFTFVPPKSRGRAKQYTVAEVIEILSESLLPQGFVIKQRTATIGIFPVDELLDGKLAVFQIGDLANMGKAEMARIVYQLKMVDALAIAPCIKKTMRSPFSEVIPLGEANQLILVGTVADLRAVVAALNDMEARNTIQSWVHHCRHCPANVIAEKLKKAVAAPGRLRRATGQQITVLADAQTNIALVSVPAHDLTWVKALAEKMDVPRRPQRILKTYVVPPGNAKAVSEFLEGIYKASPWIRINAVGDSFVRVYAPAEDQMDIGPLLACQLPRQDAVEPIWVDATYDAAKVADRLTKRLGDPVGGAPYIMADTAVNAILVKGSPQQIVDVKTLIKTHWPDSAPPQGRVHRGQASSPAFDPARAGPASTAALSLAPCDTGCGQPARSR
jgi:type II secretory pathway component GspD/PulD (secretin)